MSVSRYSEFYLLHIQIKLRQIHCFVTNYYEIQQQALLQVNRYAHARQYKRMRVRIRKLHTYLGRVVRDIERKVTEVSPYLAQELALAKRLLQQQRTDKNKLYSVHAPEVEINISKGKAHRRYEFGVKISVAVTNASNFVVGAMSLPGNPYDGHTLSAALTQVRRLTASEVEEAFVDRGYRGHGETRTKVYISGQKRGMNSAQLKRSMKRRQAIEPIIGHLKTEGFMGRNYLKGEPGDAMNVVLCGAGQNLRKILKTIRIFCLYMVELLTGAGILCKK